MPPSVTPCPGCLSLRDWPLWAAAVFVLLLLYRTSPQLGGWLLVVVAAGALVLISNKGVLA